MSSAADKDTRAVGTPGKAMQTLEQLRRSWGRLEVVEGSPEHPLRIIRSSMGDRQVWKHVSGRGSAAVFQLEREG